jgi:hypothetical protein
MNITLPKPLWFVLAFIFATALYIPLMNGTPIWDDWTYWFNDPVIINDYSYLEFWKKFTWPLSNSMQKFLYGFFKENYFVYHILAVLLHFANSFLVYVMGKKLKFSSPFLLFVLFLLSPVCVISVGWLIQIKTLLAFFFGIASFITFLQFIENKKWVYLSWIFFLLSVAAKSTLITLPVIMLICCFKKIPKLHYLFIIPFFLISAYGAYRILSSPVTQEAVKSLEPDVIRGPIAQVETLGTVQKVDKSFFVMSLYYYFWQVIIPFDNAPVKGPNHENPVWFEYLHLFFLSCLIGILWKEEIGLYVLAGHILLFPFVGIIPAPFMVVTWVSDQHLYAVLPAFLCFWIYAMEKIKFRYNWILPILLVGFFSFKTFQSSSFYKNDINFYKESIRSNPTNLPIVYNLAFAYLKQGEFGKSLSVLESTYILSQYLPEIKQRRFYNYIMILYVSLKYPEPLKIK